MAQIDLTSQETTILADILQSYLSELRMEIAGTDRFEMRTEMKKHEDIVKVLLVKFSGMAA